MSASPKEDSDKDGHRNEDSAKAQNKKTKAKTTKNKCSGKVDAVTDKYESNSQTETKIFKLILREITTHFRGHEVRISPFTGITWNTIVEIILALPV